ncbi:Tetratricopeptide repeat protein [compost metagenome]
MTFSSLLVSAMKAKQLDYRTLSSLVGVSHAYLWQLANPDKQPAGKTAKRPSRPLALKLAETLDLDRDELLRAAGYDADGGDELSLGVVTYTDFKPDAQELFKRGLEETRKGHSERGIALLKQAIGHEGVSFLRAHMGLGVAYLQAMRYDSAIAEFTKVLSLFEDSETAASRREGVEHADVHYNRGLAYQDSDRHREAIRDFEGAIALQGPHPDRYVAALCFSLLVKGQFRRVLRASQVFVDAQAESPLFTTAALDVRLYQAYALARCAQFEAALALLAAVDLLLPSYWYTAYLHGAVCSRYAQSLAECRDHRNPRVRRRLEERLEEVVQAGLRRCQRAISLNPGSRAVFLAERQGDFAYFASLPPFMAILHVESEV